MPQLTGPTPIKEHRSRAGMLPLALSLLVALCSIIIGATLGGRTYVVVSMIVVACAIVSFFVRFEQRKPQARELVMIAVMCALAVVARAAFIWVPHFKPMAAIVMIAGMAFGASSGFLVGSLSILASNLIFGQGPWTPWQMLSFGLCGLTFGALTDKGILPRSSLTGKQRIVVSLSAGLFVILAAGPILDTSSLFYLLSALTPEGAAAVYLAGLPVNCIHGVATTVTMLIFSNPLLGMLDRVRTKYGMMDPQPQKRT